MGRALLTRRQSIVTRMGGDACGSVWPAWPNRARPGRRPVLPQPQTEMPMNIFETQFIPKVTKGVNRTMDPMARASNFHGKPIAIEYLMTADIFREFAEDGVDVHVELQYRKFINAMTATNARTARTRIPRPPR